MSALELDELARTDALRRVGLNRAREAGDYETAVGLAESISEKATSAGQGIQALSLWSRLTPEGVLRYAAKVFDRANKARGLVIKQIPRHPDMVGKAIQELIKDAL